MAGEATAGRRCRVRATSKSYSEAMVVGLFVLVAGMAVIAAVVVLLVVLLRN
jgi:hypothetical protein